MGILIPRLSFRHLKYQNLFTSDNFIHISRIILLLPFLATKETLALLVNDHIISGILVESFRHLECQNPSIISDSIASWRGCKFCDTWMEHGQNNTSVILDRTRDNNIQYKNENKFKYRKVKYRTIKYCNEQYSITLYITVQFTTKINNIVLYETL